MHNAADDESAIPENLTHDPALRPAEATDAKVATDVIAAEIIVAADVPAADEPAAAAAKTFSELGASEEICAALAVAGIVTAFPIQELALPIALSGQDIIGQARTGTGKTLAFGIPLIEQIRNSPGRTPAAPRALVVVPTRELAIQVADDLRVAGSKSGTNVVTLYGGRAYEPQIEALKDVDIVVGTPGRLLDLARQKHLDLSQASALVLDEADKMLDLGFLPDVERILRLTPEHRQTMLFSATMPGEVVTLARRHLRQATHVRAEQQNEPASVPLTEQHVFRAHQMDKIEVLVRLLQAEGRGLTIVFCRTKRNVDQVAGTLTTRGFAAAAVHGDLGQGQRERAMRAFRGGKVDVLVATDVAARGLDVDDITHVVNYECPEDENAYLHRIGRTGRAGRTGVAVTFVDWADLQRWKMISEALGLDKPEPAETYSTSEHLFTALNIPAGAKGVLPRAQRERAGLEAERLEDIGETGRIRSQAGRGGRAGDGRSSDGRSSDGRAGDGHRGDGRSGEGRRGGGRNPAAGESAPVREAGRRGQRVRHRTRSGVPLTAGQDGAEQASDSNHSGPGQDGATAPAGQPATAARRPRRRRSRGAGSAGAGASGGAGGAGTETAPAAVSASTAAAGEL